MLIEVRAPDRLRGANAVEAGPLLETVMRTVQQSEVDTSTLRILLDWVQYKANFRDPVMLRRIEAGAFHAQSALELAIDLRRSKSATRPEAISAALAGDEAARVYLEPWRAGSESCIWEFNSLYWKYLTLWEQVSERPYEQALPGGESAARDTAAARALIEELLLTWDDLATRRALPETLYVLELGVGNGAQARTWLDEFREMDRTRGSDYYQRLHYLMGDFSPHVLDRARQTVGHHGTHVSTLVVDARRPADALAFLRTKAFLVYISNVYDNLPTDELVRLGGQTYRVDVRAYMPGGEAERIARAFGLPVPELLDTVHRLLRIGPEILADSRHQTFATPQDAVRLWIEVWGALRLAERYAPLEELDMYEVAPGVSGELLRPILESNGDVRLHASNGAAASFVDTLPLLHPMGQIICHDLFVTDLHGYLDSFRGPGKYDGSVVNWVNGQILRLVGRRRGYEVTFAAPFGHRPGSRVQTLRTRVME